MTGILTALAYYLIGITIAFIYDYKTSTPASSPGFHYVMLVTFGGGFLWMLATFIQAVKKAWTSHLVGIIACHLVILLCSFGYIKAVLQVANRAKIDPSYFGDVQVEKHNDTIVIYHRYLSEYKDGGDSIFFKHLFHDSASVDMKKVKFVKK